MGIERARAREIGIDEAAAAVGFGGMEWGRKRAEQGNRPAHRGDHTKHGRKACHYNCLPVDRVSVVIHLYGCLGRVHWTAFADWRRSTEAATSLRAPSVASATRSMS